MLRLFFWGLLLLNGVLFAMHRGHLDSWLPEVREPARMAAQLNADKIKLVSASAALTAPVATAAKAEIVACIEIGNFDEAEARRFETRIASLPFGGDKAARRNVPETVRHIVYIPPLGGKDGADKKVAELRKLGIKDFFVIQDNSALRWGISLGIFKSEEAANAHLDGLGQKGVRSARLGVQNLGSSKAAFQLRQLDSGAKLELDKIKAEFPNQDTRDCVAG